MAVNVNVKHIGNLNAGEDLSSNKIYRGVVIDSDDTVKLPSSQGDVPGGVLHNEPASGDAADLGISGVSKMEAGEAISGGDALTVNANGKFIKATSSDYIYARAVTKASGDGVIFSGLITNEQDK